MRFTLLLVAALATFALQLPAADHPNLLWLTCEDTGPQLGSYGDTYARTPHLDALAARGVRYTRAWSNAPVCAPARTAIITGRFPAADGAEHMRSAVALPAGHKLFPQFLREAGYYCTNNFKEDYNVAKPAGTWDASSRDAHYKHRPAGAPFFAVFNLSMTHEGPSSAPGHTFTRDPALAPIPAYHPDTPEVRRNWAQYYDKVAEMDAAIGGLLRELADRGDAANTIVFFFGDHGPGIPRSKRWPYDSGLRVPLLAYFPEKFAHLAPPGYRAGAASERLVSFVDLAPTMLALAGLRAPAYFHGAAFAGAAPGPAPEFLHGFRGRMDERYDLVRSVTDGRYVYLRHYLPHLPYTQHVSTMFRNPTMIAWARGHRAGTLDAAESNFWQPKPVEELYDLVADRWEVHNLAADRAHEAALTRLRAAAVAHADRIGDLGVIPEGERARLAAGTAPRDALAAWREKNFAAVWALARDASDAPRVPSPAPFVAALRSSDSVARWWGVTGLRIRGAAAIRAARDPLRGLFADESPSVRVAAAAALAGC